MDPNVTKLVIIFVAFILVVVVLLLLFGKYGDIGVGLTRFPCDIYCAIKAAQVLAGAVMPGGFCGC